MTISEKLALELTAAKDFISQEGELPADTRKTILQLIADLSIAEHADAGYLRRARLSLICAHEAFARLNVHENLLGDAMTILGKAASTLSGQYGMEDLAKDNGNFHTKVIDLFENGATAFVSVYAGMACFAAANTVLYDTNFDLLGQNEKDFDPDDWDASFYSSLAFSGSAVWEGKGGAENRRSYWQWYLDTAIPLAWNVETPLNS